MPSTLLPAGEITNLAEYLPGLLTIDREPMSLADFRPFVPVFSAALPPQICLIAGRQTGKTRSTGGRLVLECALRPGHKVLVVTPLQEQSDVLSSTVIKPMVEDSPVRSLLRGGASVGSVRRRDFDNRSMIQFSYAFLDTDRVRSKSAQWLYVDEAQDMDRQHIPIIEACLGGAREPVTWVSGTSKTKDTYLEAVWAGSSQGIWTVACSACGRKNRMCVEPEGHLLAMIGPPRDDVSEAYPGTVCSKCRRLINPRYGYWVHNYPERVRDCVGYYAPQPAFPIHFANRVKWAQLVGRMNGKYTTARFYNEILGAPYDSATKLVSIDDLRRVARGVCPNAEADARARGRRYRTVVMGVDWGGGGEEGVSRTKVAAIGVAVDGTAEVFFGAQFQPSTDRVVEAREILRLAVLCNAQIIAHDANGIGTTSESVLTHLEWPLDRIMPMVYRGVIGGNMIEFARPQGARIRGYYVMNKGKVLQFLCSAIRAGRIRTFDYDYLDTDRPGLLHDFLTLVEDSVDTPTGSAYRVRKRHPTESDDFAHAVCFGTTALWQLTATWPNLAHPGVVGAQPAGDP